MTTQESSPVRGSALRNAGWLAADKIIRMGVGVAVGIWIAHYLGPTDYGLLSYSIAFASLFAWLSDLGLDRIVVRELVTARFEPSKLLGSAFVLKLIGGFLIIVAATASAYVLNSADIRTATLVAIAAAGAVAQAFDVVDYHFQSRIQSKYVSIARSSAFQVISLVKVFLILWKAPLVAFALAGLAETMLAATLLVIIHRQKARLTAAWQWDFSTARALLQDSWPLMFSSLMIVLYMRIDQVMLKSISSLPEVGKYAASVQLSEGWYFILMALSVSVFPKLVEAAAISEDQLDRTIRRFYAAMILVSYAFALPLSLLSGVLSAVLFGPAYDGMGGMLAIAAWAGVFAGVGLVRGAYCTARNLNKFLLVSTTAGAALNIVLNLLLIPQYGGRGAAAATLASYALAGYGTSFFYGPVRHQGKLITQMLLPWNSWKYFEKNFRRN